MKDTSDLLDLINDARSKGDIDYARALWREAVDDGLLSQSDSRRILAGLREQTG